MSGVAHSHHGGSSAAELLFNALDADGDGVITRDEMRAGLQEPSPPRGSPSESVFTVAARTRALAQMAEAQQARQPLPQRTPERTPPARSSPSRVSPGHVLQGSARASTSPAQGGLSYEPAFVEALQAQQRARLEETLSAAERLLSAKEDEIAQLTAKAKAGETFAGEKEASLQQQLDAATSKLAQVEVETEARRTAQEHAFASELAELKAIRTQELSHLRRQHDDETEELRTRNLEQQATVDANRRAVVDQMSRQQRDESHTADKARDLAAMYELQVQQLDQMLRDETQRLAEVRDELCAVTMQGSNAVLKERAEAAELRRKLTDAEEELTKREGAHEEAVEMSKRQHSQSVKQGELKAAIALAEEEWREELHRKDKELTRLRRKVQELIQKGASQQAQHDVELQQVRSDVLRMKESHGTTVQFSRQQVDQNKELMRLSRQLQKEVGISSNEVKLLENETRRLREDNVELRREVARLDNIIYGRKGVMASGRKAASTPRALSASASRARSKTPQSKTRVGKSNMSMSGVMTPKSTAGSARRRRRSDHHSPERQAWGEESMMVGTL